MSGTSSPFPYDTSSLFHVSLLFLVGQHKSCYLEKKQLPSSESRICIINQNSTFPCSCYPPFRSIRKLLIVRGRRWKSGDWEGQKRKAMKKRRVDDDQDTKSICSEGEERERFCWWPNADFFHLYQRWEEPGSKRLREEVNIMCVWVSCRFTSFGHRHSLDMAQGRDRWSMTWILLLHLFSLLHRNMYI